MDPLNFLEDLYLISLPPPPQISGVLLESSKPCWKSGKFDVSLPSSNSRTSPCPTSWMLQLRNIRRKLEADLQSSNKRLVELVEQKDALKEGREESVSILSFRVAILCN